jgi:hypothetical protein
LQRREHEYLHCIAKRHLSRRELRRYGLRNTPLFEAQSSAGSVGSRLKTVLLYCCLGSFC